MIGAAASILGQVDRPEPIETPDIEWSALAPILALVVGALVLLVVASLAKRWLFDGFYALFTVVAAAVAIATALPLWARVQGTEPGDGPYSIAAGALGVDGFSLFFTVLISATVILAALLADGYLRREGLDGPEPYVLMLFSASGGVIMASANDLIVLFLGLEVMSISVYVLAAMHARRPESQEAGIKYFVLGAFSSAFFLYGIALVYGATGSTDMVEIGAFLADNILLETGLLFAGFALLLVGLAFKVAAVPFHSWAPDVYQGAPSPAVAFMASAVKAGAFAGLLRLFVVTFGTYAVDWQPVIYALAVLSLVVGSALAIVQRDVKRMLAYSSIVHAGFILVAVQAASEDGVAAALFYLAAYTFMVVGSFGVITVWGRGDDDAHDLDDYAGLARSRPLLPFAFSIFLLGQAGVPLTSGFFAKFYVIQAAVEARSYWLAAIAMLASVVAAFLYLRVIVRMYSFADPEGEESRPPRVLVPPAAGIAIGVAFAVTVVAGFVPWTIADWAREAVPVLVATPQ